MDDVLLYVKENSKNCIALPLSAVTWCPLKPPASRAETGHVHRIEINPSLNRDF
jgi:hypothetical protein